LYYDDQSITFVFVLLAKRLITYARQWLLLHGSTFRNPGYAGEFCDVVPTSRKIRAGYLIGFALFRFCIFCSRSADRQLFYVLVQCNDIWEFSETSEIKPALSYSYTEFLVGFPLILKLVTLNGYFMLNSVLAPVSLEILLLDFENNV